jgi:hypothetical protein
MNNHIPRPHGFPTSPTHQASQANGQQIIQGQARQIAELERDHANLKMMYDQFFQVYRNPPQQRAGVIEYPDKRPFMYLYRKELKNGDSSFGEGALDAGTVQASFKFDAGRPTYLRSIQFALIRTAHAAPSPTIPLNTYLPLAGLSPSGAKGLDFRWKATISKGDLNLSEGWMDSAIFDLHGGYETPVEAPMYEDSVLTVEAQPWGSADTSQSEAFSLFCILHCYKMRAS